MAHPYHHSLSSTRKHNLPWTSHFDLHDWLDSSKSMFSDARHRALFHQTTGVFLSKKIFKDIKNCETIAREHIEEDIGFVPSIGDWLPEQFWSPRLSPSKHLSITDLKGSLVYKNPFPKKTQRELLECCNILLSPEKTQKLDNSSPLRFFYFHSGGPYLCQMVLGPLLDGDIPTRTICEYFIQKTWGKIPSFQDIMEIRPIEDWMWKKAKPLSKTLPKTATTK